MPGTAEGDDVRCVPITEDVQPINPSTTRGPSFSVLDVSSVGRSINKRNVWIRMKLFNLPFKPVNGVLKSDFVLFCVNFFSSTIYKIKHNNYKSKKILPKSKRKQIVKVFTCLNGSREYSPWWLRHWKTHSSGEVTNTNTCIEIIQSETNLSKSTKNKIFCNMNC